LQVANYQQMNFTQMHERLRIELLRRIQRGTLSVSLLGRQTGLCRPHVSNFLHSVRQLSMGALDRVLAAQHLSAGDLLPAMRDGGNGESEAEEDAIPIVSNFDALTQLLIRPALVKSVLPFPTGILNTIRPRAPGAQRAWQRFVAVRIPAADALPMEPLVLPGAIAVIDRHYTSLANYRPNRPNVYAVQRGAHLVLRYVELRGHQLVLRPHNMAFPVELIEVEMGASASDRLTGRVVAIVNRL
jgi:hypothetical protein